MGCGDKKLSKSLTQTFTAHCNAMICQQVTLSGDAEWPKVADAVIEDLFAMKGFHHPSGSQAAFLTGLAHLYNLIPYQRRAKNAGLCGVQVEGGRVPTSDWMLNLHILTSGGYQYAPDPPNH